SWREPDADYEAALAVRVARVLPPGGAPWLEPIRDLAGRIAYAGALGALATALIKVAAPGVPDYYQGAEDWHYPLVDPDNRRPVDFDALAARAIELAAAIDADSPL